jgi:hypothetical protein
MKTFYQRTIVLMTVATAAVVVRTGLPPLLRGWLILLSAEYREFAGECVGWELALLRPA